MVTEKIEDELLRSIARDPLKCNWWNSDLQAIAIGLLGFLALLAAGFKLVPETPTDAMLPAAEKEYSVKNMYKAMLSKAQPT